MNLGESNLSCAWHFVSHRLQQHRSCANSQYSIESQNRISQMVQHAIKEDHIKSAERPGVQIIDAAKKRGHFRAQRASTNIESANRVRKRIYCDDFRRSTSLGFKRK